MSSRDESLAILEETLDAFVGPDPAEAEHIIARVCRVRGREEIRFVGGGVMRFRSTDHSNPDLRGARFDVAVVHPGLSKDDLLSIGMLTHSSRYEHPVIVESSHAAF